MSLAFRTLIVPAAALANSRALAAGLSDGGVGMWTTGLSPTGAAPATHYISSGIIDSDFAAILPLAVYERAFDAQGAPLGWSQASSLPGSAATVRDMALSRGQPGVTHGAVQALFDAADVTEQGPQEAMSRLGLQLVVEDEI